MIDIEKEFSESKATFMAEAYKDGERAAWHLDSVETLGFNTWTFLTKAEPLFDEIRIRVASDEEIKRFEGESEYDAPTIDAIEVVRCRDCKYLYSDNGCPLRTFRTHVDDDYCSRGERK